MCVYSRLLVKLPDALYIPDIAGVLGKEKPRVGAVDLPMGFFPFLRILKGLDLGLRENVCVVSRPFGCDNLKLTHLMGK